nr:hypothetical protein [Tanacetum cinerariifolium]
MKNKGCIYSKHILTASLGFPDAVSRPNLPKGSSFSAIVTPSHFVALLLKASEWKSARHKLEMSCYCLVSSRIEPKSRAFPQNASQMLKHQKESIKYALTATVDVSAVYIQQFWKTVKQVPNAKETIRFIVYKQEITYIMDMFRVTLKLLLETPEQPFIPPADFDYIQPFLMILSYQGPIDKEYKSIPQRLEEDYHTIKDDKPFVNVYTTGEVTVRGMLIPNDLLTDAIRNTQAYKDYKAKYGGVEVLIIQPEPVESTQGTHRTPNLNKPTSTTPLPQSDDQERYDIIEATQLSLSLDKTAKAYEEQHNVDAVEKKILEEDVEKLVEGEEESMENLKKNDDDDDDDEAKHEKHDDAHDDDDHHDDEKVNEALKDIVPKIATTATNDLITENFPRIVANLFKKEKESSQATNTILNVHLTTKLWDVLKAKFEKSSASAGSCRNDAFRKSDHDDHQGDDAPHKGEKNVKRQKASKSSKYARAIFDHERMEATIEDMLSSQFRDDEEYAYHLEQAQNYMENQIAWESMQEDLK